MVVKINSDLLPIKAHFFLVFSATAPVVPFIPVLAKQLGFDEVGVGVIFSVLPFAGMLAKPLAGMVADHWGKQKLVFMASILLTGVAYFALQLVTDIKADNPAVFSCSSPRSVLSVCREEEVKMSSPPTCPQICRLVCSMQHEQEMKQVCRAFDDRLPGCTTDPMTPLYATKVEFSISSNLSVHDTQPRPTCILLPVDLVTLVDYQTNTSEELPGVSCDTLTEISCQAQCDNEELQRVVRKDSVFSSTMFWIFFLVLILAYSSFMVATSMGDAVCFQLLGGQHEQYGTQRVWGSIGWGLATVLAGYLVDSSSSSSSTHKDFSPAFLLMAGLLILDLLVTSRLKVTSPPSSSRAWQEILQLSVNPRVAMFVVWCFVCGALTAVIWNWLLWYLADLANNLAHSGDCSGVSNSGGSWVTVLLGLNMGIQCFVGEVPMFFLSGWVLRTLGHANTMTLVLGAFGVRFLIYSVLVDPWWSLPVEILNGITFGIFYSTMTSYAHMISPPGLESTMQGLVGATYEGAGVAVGSLVGGAVYHAKGGAFMFRMFGLVSIIVCVLHALCQGLLGKFGVKMVESKDARFEVVASGESDVVRKSEEEVEDAGPDRVVLNGALLSEENL